MRPRSLGLLLVVVLGPGACGGDEEPSTRAVGLAYAKALEEEDWQRACSLTRGIPRCTQILRDSYAGRRVTLLPAGGYQNGDAVTDNVTRFAVESAGRRERSTAYYEVDVRDGRAAVHAEITVIR